MSLIIFAGIVVGLPRAVADLFDKFRTAQWGPFTGLALILLDGHDDRGGRASSFSWKAASGAFRCSMPSVSWAAG